MTGADHQIDTEFADALARRIILAKDLLEHLHHQIGPEIKTLAAGFIGSMHLERFTEFETSLQQLADVLGAFGGDVLAIQRMESLAKGDGRRERWEALKGTRLGFSTETCAVLAEALHIVLQFLPTIWALYYAFQSIPDCFSGTPELWSGDLQILPDDLREAANIALWQVCAVELLGGLGRLLESLFEQPLGGIDPSAVPLTVCGYQISPDFISAFRERTEQTLRSLQQRASVLQPALLVEHALAAAEVPVVGDNDAQTAHQLANMLCERAADSLERLAHEPIKRFFSRLPAHRGKPSSILDEKVSEILDVLCQLPEFDLATLARAIKREASRAAGRRAELTPRPPQAAMAATAPAIAEEGTKTEDVVSDPITLEQAARLVGKGIKTMYNVRKKSPRPEPAIARRGSKPAVWSYATLRPWLLENWPAMEYQLSSDYEKAKPLFEPPA